MITPRGNLPAAVVPLLPRRGIYGAGGGLTSGSWRVVVDLDRNTVEGGENPAGNSSSLGPMPKPVSGELSKGDEKRLVELANQAWRAPRAPPTDPTADYDEICIVIDGDDAYYLQGFGPIREPVAAKLLLELRAVAGLGL